MLGPTGGTILGYYLVLGGWRWTLRFMTILIGINTLTIILFMDETYASVLERLYNEGDPSQRGERISFVARLRAMFRGNPEAKNVVVRAFTVSANGFNDPESLADVLNLKRPPRMLMNPACAVFVFCECQSKLSAVNNDSRDRRADISYIYASLTEPSSVALAH